VRRGQLVLVRGRARVEPFLALLQRSQRSLRSLRFRCRMILAKSFFRRLMI